MISSIQPSSSAMETIFSQNDRNPIRTNSQWAIKLQDGPHITASQPIFDDQKREIGVFEFIAPAWTVDGDVRYKVSIGLDPKLPAAAQQKLLDRLKHISIKVNNKVFATITPQQLTADTKGNPSFISELTNLIHLTQDHDLHNDVNIELVFSDRLNSVTLHQQVTSGQKHYRAWSADKKTEINVFSVLQAEFIASNDNVNRDIHGNHVVNKITVSSGRNRLYGADGNDRFIIRGGDNFIDGGRGIDTVRISMNRKDAGAIVKNGNSIKIGDRTTMTDVEFIEFNDVRLATKNLDTVPIVLTEPTITVMEGATARVVVNLSSPVNRAVEIDYLAQSGNDAIGLKTVAQGRLIIPAGKKSGYINIKTIDGRLPRNLGHLYVNLKIVSGETFEDNTAQSTIDLYITEKDTALGLSMVGDISTLEESTQTIMLERFGNLSGTDILKFQVVAAGSNPVQAEDFVGGFTAGQVSFAPGEHAQVIEIPISPDRQIESDETFGLRLTRQSGSIIVPNRDVIFTIRDSGNYQR
jgi:Calx-beta domain